MSVASENIWGVAVNDAHDIYVNHEDAGDDDSISRYRGHGGTALEQFKYAGGIYGLFVVAGSKLVSYMNRQELSFMHIRTYYREDTGFHHLSGAQQFDVSSSETPETWGLDGITSSNPFICTNPSTQKINLITYLKGEEAYIYQVNLPRFQG